MNKHITEFTLQDAKSVVGDERFEWLNKVQDAIEELESLDVTALSHTNEIYGEDFVEKELKRLYDIKDRLEYETNLHFGDINLGDTRYMNLQDSKSKIKETIELIGDYYSISGG